MSLLNNAIIFATDKHGEQTRKDGSPYILHPLAVMLDPSLKNTATRVVAVLHDILEDTDASIQELKDLGLPAVCIDAIQLLTKQKSMDYEDYIADILANPLALVVKKADVRHNSSEAELAKLPSEKERSYLRKKYVKARKRLGMETM